MTLPYIHLSLAERREIARMYAAKIPISVIADRLQPHRSTIYREIKRNWVHDEEPLYRGYFHVAADMQARARRQRLGKLSRKPVLVVYVVDRLKAGWSPEQIAGRLRAALRLSVYLLLDRQIARVARLPRDQDSSGRCNSSRFVEARRKHTSLDLAGSWTKAHPFILMAFMMTGNIHALRRASSQRASFGYPRKD